MPVIVRTAMPLVISNVFMTFAWYGHLRTLGTLTVFVPFALLYMRTPFKWDYLWAGVCLIGAVYFIFRS